MKRLMSEEEFRKELKKYDLNVAEACTSIENRTGCIINSRNISNLFSKQDYLTNNLTGVFRLFFREKEREKKLKESNDRQRA